VSSNCSVEVFTTVGRLPRCADHCTCSGHIDAAAFCHLLNISGKCFAMSLPRIRLDEFPICRRNIETAVELQRGEQCLLFREANEIKSEPMGGDYSDFGVPQVIEARRHDPAGSRVKLWHKKMPVAIVRAGYGPRLSMFN